jgi:hypothetical protein
MKTKLLLILPFLLVTYISMAQRIGLKGGVNIANWEVNPAVTNFHPEDITLMHLGFVYEGRLLGGIHVNTGLFYTEKGYKESFKDDNGNVVNYSWDKYMYMEVPFNLELKTLIAHRSYLFIQGGPYGGYAFMGRAYRYGEYGLIDFERSGLNHYDYGLGFGGGLELGNLVLSVNWQRGFANLNRNPSGSEIKNNILQFSIAIMGSTK